MTAASNSEASEYAIENGWLCEVAKVHTCGTDPGGYFGAHEPGCGLIPVARIDDLLAAHAAQATQTPTDAPIPAPVDSGTTGRLAGPQNTDEGVGTGAGEGAPRQDTASAWVTRSTDCPEAPAQAHPLAGRLNERQTVDALLACLPMHEDGTGHIADCGYDEDATPTCGCYPTSAADWAEIAGSRRAAGLLALDEITRLRAALDEYGDLAVRCARERDEQRKRAEAAEKERDEARAEVSRWEVHFGTTQEQRDDALARLAAAESVVAAVRRALDDELANLADDGARLSHSVVRRIEAVLPAPTSPERSKP